MSDCSRIRNHTLRAVVCVCLVLTAAPAGIASLSTIAVAQAGNQSVQVDVDPTNLPGNGTQSDPHKISNASELQAIEDDLGANYTLVNDIDASNTAHWNNGTGFDPIGAFIGESFTGSFDGRGNTISGLTIRRPSELDVGLFGGNEGTIKNIRIKNATISGQLSVGSIAATSQGIVSDVNVSGTIDGSEQVGRVVGFNQGGTVTDAFAAGPITGSGDVGGLVGINTGAIRNSTASGSVNGTEFVGGLTGFNSGTVKNVTTSGSTTGSNFIGGLAGSNDGGTIRRATVSGDVVGSAGVGGIVGNNIGTIQNTTVSGSVSGNNAVGGLAGTSDNSTVQNVAALNSVTGSRNVSGLIGINGGTIRDAFAAGSISGENDTGGLVAFNAGTVQNAYWDEQATEQSTSAGGEALSTAQMQGRAARSNMSGLAFGATWQIQSNDYPALIPPAAERGSSLANLSIAGQGTEAVILRGTDVNVSVNVTNVGEVTDNFTVTVDVSDDTVNRSVDVPNVFTETTEQVEFDGLNTSGLPAQDEPFNIRITTETDTVTGNLTVLQPAQANLTNISVENQGSETQIVNGENKNISVDIKNSGDLSGNFSTSLTIGGEPVPSADEQAVELESGEARSLTFENATGKVDFSVFNDELPTEFDVNVSTVNDSTSTNLTVDPQRANITVQQQATESPTIDPIISTSRTSPTVVVQNVSANINSTVVVTNETDGSTLRVAGITDPRSARTLDGTNQFNISLDTSAEFPRTHVVHVIPNPETPSVSQGDIIDSALIENATVSQNTPLFQGTVDIQNQSVTGPTDTVTINQSNLQPANASEYVIVLHNQSATTGLVGPAFGSSDILTGSESNVTITLDDGAQIDSTQNVVAMLHFPSNDSAFATAIPNADATEGFAAGNIADRAAVTVKQPAEANLTNISIAGQGAEAEVFEGRDERISVGVTNTGEVPGNFTVSLNVGSSDVIRSQNVSVEAGNTAQVEFSDITGDLTDGEFNVTISAGNESLSGFLIVEQPQAELRVDQQATNSSTINPAIDFARTNDAIVVENVSADVNSTIIVTNETDGSTLRVAGITDSQSTATLDGTNKFNIPLNTSAEFPGTHVVHVIPTTQTSNVSPGDIVESTLVESAAANQSITLFQGAVETQDETIIGSTDTVTVAQSNLQPAAASDYVIVLHNQSATDGLVGPAFGSSDVLTGSESNVTITLDDGTQVGSTQNVVAMLHFPPNDPDSAFATAIPNADQTEGFAAGNIANRATVTVKQPAEANLTDLSIAGEGAGATLQESTDANVSVNITNIGEVTGNFTASLNIGSGEVTRSQDISVEPDNTAQLAFRDVTATLPAGNFDVTVSVANESISGNLTVSSPTPPASVTITDQVVSNGSSSLTVDSAQFGNQSVPGEAFVVVVHKTTVEGNIGAKIGESAVLANGTQQNIEVNVSQEIEQGDDIAALTTPQTVVAMLHRANTADSDGINHGTPITRNSSRITDRAQITIGDRELEIEPPSQIERGEPFAVEVLNTSGVAVSGVTVELSLGPETNNQINTTNAGGVAILEVPDDSSDEVVTITASPDGLPAYATGDQVTITGIRDPGDLQLSSLSVAPSEVTLNTSVTVAAKITNTGSTALNQTLTIAANETGVLTNRTVEIPGNTSRTVTLTPVLSTLGTQNILINDQLAGTVSVTEFTPPTAELSTLLLDGSPPPVEVAATSDVNVSLEITNNGDVSGQFTPSLSAGGISRTRTLELNASETQSIAFENVAANLRPRPTPYTLSVSTENETITGNLRIGDTDTGSLRITETRAPARVSDGDRFTVSVRVGNFGPNVTTDELALAVDKDRDGNFTGETVDTRQQTLVANGTAQIPFRATATGDEQLRFRVTTDNDTITGNISVVSTDYTTAVSTGDPHIVSFDGVAYDFQAAGEFILTREPTANGSLVVQARQEPLAGSDSITRNTAVATIVDNQTVIIDATDETPLQVNGSRVELSQSDTHAVGNGTITRNDNSLTITYPGTDNEATLGDEYLTVDLYGSRIDIELNLDPERDRPVEGVFGPADGNITNDISLPNGTALAQPPRAEQLYGVFRESWRVNNSTTLFGYEADNGPETYYNPRIPAEAVSIADLDQATRTEAERLATEAGLQPGTTAFRNAVLDYALTDDSSYFTSAQQQNTSAETDRSVGTPTESTIRVESRSVGVGETAPVNLTLERAPEGLAGYNLTVSVSVADAEGINVTDATAPTIFNSSVTETTVGPENQTAEIRATDIKSAVQANATNTRLGSVIVAADTDTNVSTVDVTVSVSRIDDDTGDPIDVETQNGTVIVTQQPPLAPNLNAPTDLDGDGVFEDINGNGRLDFNDVVALFENLPNAEVPFQDINGNGRIDFDDIVELFKQI